MVETTQIPETHIGTHDGDSEKMALYKDFLKAQTELFTCKKHYLEEKIIRKRFLAGLCSLNDTLKALQLPLIKDGDKMYYQNHQLTKPDIELMESEKTENV